MSLGTLWFDEEPYAIERVSLGEGRLFLWTEHKPLTRRIEGEYDLRVHAPDGTLVLVARTTFPTMDPKDWENFGIRLPVRIEGSLPGEPWSVGTGEEPTIGGAT